MRLADKITIGRMILVPIMVALAILGWKWSFISLFILILLADVLDGYVARKEDGGTKKGELLDSYADFFVGLSVIVLFFLLFPEVYSENTNIIILLLIMIVIPFVFSLIRFKRLPEYHLITNKINAVVVYTFFIFSFVFGYEIIFLYVVVGCITLNTIEKVMLIGKGKMNAQIKSVFHESNR